MTQVVVVITVKGLNCLIIVVCSHFGIWLRYALQRNLNFGKKRMQKSGEFLESRFKI